MTVIDVTRRRLTEARLPEDLEAKVMPPAIPDLRRRPHDADWMGQADCLGKGELFFSDSAADVEAARDLCAQCPVRAQCLAYATRIRPGAGVWAGQTARHVNVVRRAGAMASAQSVLSR